MQRDPDAEVFFGKLIVLLRTFATDLGLVFAKGAIHTTLTGKGRALSLFGPYDRLHIALIVDASETLLTLEQVRMRWYARASTDRAFTLGQLPGNPLLTRLERGFGDVERDIRRMLGFLHGKDVEDIIDSLVEATQSALEGSDFPDTLTDPNNHLPSEGFPDDPSS